jgi:hypothetical protein
MIAEISQPQLTFGAIYPVITFRGMPRLDRRTHADRHSWLLQGVAAHSLEKIRVLRPKQFESFPARIGMRVAMA